MEENVAEDFTLDKYTAYCTLGMRRIYVMRKINRCKAGKDERIALRSKML